MTKVILIMEDTPRGILVSASIHGGGEVPTPAEDALEACLEVLIQGSDSVEQSHNGDPNVKSQVH